MDAETQLLFDLRNEGAAAVETESASPLPPPSPDWNYPEILLKAFANDLSLDFADEIEAAFADYAKKDREKRTESKDNPPKSGSKYYIYFYLDVSRLPADMSTCTFRQFVRAIIYIGKGSLNRIYFHLNGQEIPLVGFLPDDVTNKEKCMAIYYAYKEAGICMHLAYFYVHENEAFGREGCMINVLQNQLSNDKGGDFPDVNYWTEDKKNRLGVQCLLQAYKTFQFQQCYKIDDLEHLSNTKNACLANMKKFKDEKGVNALHGCLEKTNYSIDFESYINDFAQHPKFFELNTVNSYFQKKHQYKNFVYLYLDGSKFPQASFKDITFKDYVEMIFTIGIDKNLDQPFHRLLMLVKGKRQRQGQINDMLRERLDQDKGIMVQLMFPICTINDARFKKSCMINALDTGFFDDCTNDVVEDLSNLVGKQLTQPNQFKNLGWYFLYCSWRSFAICPPFVMTKDDMF